MKLLIIIFLVFVNICHANTNKESSDFDLVKKNFPMPVIYSDEKIINIADKLKPLVESFINNFPQSKLLFDLQKLTHTTTSAYLAQGKKDLDNKVYENRNEMESAYERYGILKILTIDGKINIATALLTASYSKNSKIISCAIGDNVSGYCMDTDYFNGIGFEKIAYATMVAGGLGREMAKKMKKVFLTNLEKDKICSSTLGISSSRGATLVKIQLQECSKK